MSRHEVVDPSLPPPLTSALDEFDAWTQEQLRIDERKFTPTSPLYHYTGGHALRGILEKQKIWCFSHNQQKDIDEVGYSLNIARRVVREEARGADPYVDSLLMGLDDILGNNPLHETFGFYFFSLSSHRDDAKQWVEYGDEGRGFAIGFSPTLFQPDRQQLAAQANENFFVGRVVYGKDPTLTRHRKGIRKLAEITKRTARANTFLIQGNNKQTWFDNMNKLFITSQLVWNCLTAKRARFHSEQETRYILLGVHKTFDSCRKTYNGRNFVEIPLPLSE